MQLVIHDLDEGVKTRLQALAWQLDHSMEEEARAILHAATALDEQKAEHLGTRIARRFAGLGLDDAIPELHGQQFISG